MTLKVGNIFDGINIPVSCITFIRNLTNLIIVSGLKNLDSLILAHNQLTKVPAKVFSHLTVLNSLELEGNQITYIDKDAFAGLEGKFIIKYRGGSNFKYAANNLRQEDINTIDC